jgi:putative tryptophan/tyrosine transport system substrate-binding protein
MRRREFIVLLGGATAWPLAASAQQRERLPRIGYLGLSSAAQGAYGGIDAFLAGLSQLGYVEGRNIHVEFRFSDGVEDRLPSLAAELVALNVDVIVTYATGVLAAQRATRTIPIVMATYTDPVATGLIASLAHPGGNVTGSTFFQPGLMAKRLEFLKEVAPSMTRAGVFLIRGSPSRGPILEAMGAAAAELQPIEIDRLTDLEGAFSQLDNQRISALVVQDHAFFLANADAIAGLATSHRISSISSPKWAASGGLMGYGVNFSDMFRRATVFVDKILKGANPGNIPVEQATKFETTVNLKTAKAIGVTVPTSILLRADEVIE